MANKIHFLGEGNRGARGGRLYVFHCPGCGINHRVETDVQGGWSWNGSLDKPTFAPSVLRSPDSDFRCHSFVAAGRIHFLGDCYHDLKGQTVDLPDWE